MKEYFVDFWGDPEPGVRWYGYRIRSIDDDVKDGIAIVLDDDLVSYNNDGTSMQPL